MQLLLQVQLLLVQMQLLLQVQLVLIWKGARTLPRRACKLSRGPCTSSATSVSDRPGHRSATKEVRSGFAMRTRCVDAVCVRALTLGPKRAAG